MKENIVIAIRLTLVCLLFFSGIYTCIVLGIAQVAPNKGVGALVKHGDKEYYSNIAQKFTEDKYFNSRPSAVGYNAAGAGGSNKGPTNPDYLKDVQSRIDSFLAHNPGVDKSAIPSDLVTASGSGLDPHISPQAALVQVNRIAKVRNLSVAKLNELVAAHTEKPLLGYLGTERVNVLTLNIALDLIK